MRRRRRAVAGLVAVALAAGLQTATWRPAPVQATVPPPDSIATYAGGIGSGTATLIGQMPVGLAVHGSVLYVSDDSYDVVRAIDLNTGHETVVAGGRPFPACTEPCPATSAFIFPQGLATDSAGNLYITDFGQQLNGVVRKVDLSGTISTFAGGGIGCAEPCPATSAKTVTPDDVAVDSAGNVYFADYGDLRVRKVDGSGNITTIAGNGTHGYTGDGGLATSAQLAGPTGVAIDSSGDVYISDYGNNVVRRVDHSTHFISTFAGGGGSLGDGGPATSAFLYHPIGLHLDSAGNVYIADRDQARVRKVDTGGTITTYAGTSGGGPLGDGGPATSAHLMYPVAVALDASDNLFIADAYSMRVRRVDHSTLNISTEAGFGTPCGPAGDGGQALDAQVCGPSGMTFDSGDNLYFADLSDGRIRKITPGGVVSTVAGGGAGCAEPCPATSAKLNKPNAVAVDSLGNLLIADTNDEMVKEVDHLTGDISTIAGTGGAGYSGDGGPATSAQLFTPYSVAVDAAGNVYIADLTNQRIRKIDKLSGDISTVAGTGVAGFSGDHGPGTSAQLNIPSYVALDGSGNLFITDSSNGRIRKLSSGVITTVAGGGDPSCPSSPNGDGLPAICASLLYAGEIHVVGGRLFIAAGHIRVVSPDGMISTLAGCQYPIDPDCPPQFVEGGPATQANVGGNALAVDSNENVFLANANSILRVQVPIAPNAPTAAVAHPGDSQVTVTWTPGAANGNPIYRYTVTPYQGITPQTPVEVTGLPVPTSVTVPRLSNGTPYSFKVTATNAFGTSPISQSNIVVPAAAPPGGINTHAGSVGSGPALSLGQMPYSLAVSGTHVYIGDFANPVVRDLNTGNGQEGSLAGNDGYGYTGDGHQAAAAMIQGAGAIASCGGGITYIADTYNYVIRRIDAGGNITTVAGTGQPGYSGDGGPATSAQISRVFGLACRSSGGLYISDSDNGAVRILDATGNISTWWFGFSFPTGIVETGGTDVASVSDAGLENVVWGLTDSNACVQAGQAPAQFLCGSGAATSTPLNDPRGLDYATGTLFVADRGDNRVYAVGLSFESIQDYAGNGTAGFAGDTGASYLAELDQPSDVVVDLSDNLVYIADGGNFRVRAVNITNSTITTVAGNGTPSFSGDGGSATAAQLGNPYAVAIDTAGNQYIADNQNNTIRKIDLTGVITTVAGTGVGGFSGDGGLATSAKLNDPRGVAVDASGNIYISDAGNQRIRKVDHASGIITTIAGTGVPGFTSDGGSATSAKINFPRAVVVDGSGNVYIADTANNRVRKVTPGGIISTVAGTGTAGYSGNGGLATAAMLNGPRGLAIDSLGNLYIGDTANNRVRKVDHTTAGITTVAGNGTAGLAGDGHAAMAAELNFPFGIGFDGTGNLFIADTLNQRIRMVDTNGNISSVVGTCGIVAGFAGDGGPASTAEVNYPYGVAVDAFNNLYIADVDNNRVRGANGLAGFRGSPCPGPAGTPGSRSALPSGLPGSPGTRIEQHPSGARMAVGDRPLSTAHAGAPVRPNGTTAAHPIVAQPATAPSSHVSSSPLAAAATHRHAPAATVVSRPSDPSQPRQGALWSLILLVPIAILTMAVTLARRRAKRVKR